MRVLTKTEPCATGECITSNQRTPDPKPRPTTTGDNNNTLSTNLTFIKCLQEGQAVGYVEYMLGGSFQDQLLSFPAYHFVYSIHHPKNAEFGTSL